MIRKPESDQERLTNNDTGKSAEPSVPNRLWSTYTQWSARRIGTSNPKWITKAQTFEATMWTASLAKTHRDADHISYKSRTISLASAPATSDQITYHKQEADHGTAHVTGC